MRTRHRFFFLASALFVIGGIYWFVTMASRHEESPHNEHKSTFDADAFSDLKESNNTSGTIKRLNGLNRPDISPRELHYQIVRYRSAKNGAVQSAIADEVASSLTNLWEACAWRMMAPGDGNARKLALTHFASAYFKKGQRRGIL